MTDTAVQTETGTDTSGMKSIHRVFRQAFGAAPQLIRGAPDGDRARSALVGTYYHNVLRLLHSHHQGEDELIWPKLLERCTEETFLVQSMSSQHGDLAALIDLAEAQVARWSESADRSDGEALTMTLVALNLVLVEHLDEEEELVLPLCSKYITEAEWAELPRHGMSTFDGDKPWLITGLAREQMWPDQVAAMDAEMPPPARQMWAQFGQVAFTRFITELRAPLVV